MLRPLRAVAVLLRSERLGVGNPMILAALRVTLLHLRNSTLMSANRALTHQSEGRVLYSPFKRTEMAAVNKSPLRYNIFTPDGDFFYFHPLSTRLLTRSTVDGAVVRGAEERSLGEVLFAFLLSHMAQDKSPCWASNILVKVQGLASFDGGCLLSDAFTLLSQKSSVKPQSQCVVLSR